jgi:hypothetical protein
MAVLDVVNKSELVQRHDCLLDVVATVVQQFVAGEWAIIAQHASTDLEMLTASKFGASAPTKADIGALFAPCFTATEDNSSDVATDMGSFVFPQHTAWTDYYDTVAAPTTGVQLTIKSGKLYTATTNELVVAKCLAGVTAKQVWSQGAPKVNMIKYVTVEPHVFVALT